MKHRGIMATFASIVLMLVMCTAAYAAEDPAPFPSEHAALLTLFVPELAELPAEQWLMTGYRFFYDFYSYDENDEVISTEMILIDVVGKGNGYMMSGIYKLAYDDLGNIITFELIDYVVDYPGVGEFWISLDAFRGKDAPAIRDDVFSVEEYTWNDETQDAWHAYLMSEDGNTDYEYFFSMEDGIMLSLDVFEYDANDNYLGGTALKYYDYYDYSAPWLDYGLMEMEEGIDMIYDMKVTMSDGSISEGTMHFIPVANHTTWVEVSQVLESDVLGDSEGTQFVSEMCIDGLIMWLPAEPLKFIEEGDYYFQDEITGSYVLAGGLESLEGIGETRRISFKNGYFEADSYFRQDGALVVYRQFASDKKPYELVLTLREIKK